MMPSTTKQWKVGSTDKGLEGLEFEEASIPSLGENDLLVRFHAVSLNFRELMVLRVGRTRIPESARYKILTSPTGGLPIPSRTAGNTLLRWRRGGSGCWQQSHALARR